MKSYFGKAFNDLHIELCLRQVPKQEGFDRIRELFVNLEKLSTGDAKLQAKLARELVDLREFKHKNEEVARFYRVLQQDFLKLTEEHEKLLAEYHELTSPKQITNE
jgi:arginine repressor